MNQPPTPPAGSSEAAANATNPSPAPAQWPPADSTVVCTQLTASFGGIIAVSNLSFAIGAGVTGLLGPNGAGKSTLIRMICGLESPVAGSVWVAGGNPRTSQNVRSRVALVPQQDTVFESLTGLEFVTLGADLNDVPNPATAARAMLELVNLDSNMKKPLADYSKGMKQRAKIAFALVKNPSAIILDEPLNGLDPIQRAEMISLFQTLGEQGRTVLVSSHILEEVERFGSQIIVLNAGRLVAIGNYREIRAKLNNIPRTVAIHSDKAPVLAAQLVSMNLVSGVTNIQPETFHAYTNSASELALSLPLAAQSANARLMSVTPTDDDLESVFRYLMEGT